MHGFTQTKASWARLAGELEDSFEVVTVDLPGHGGSYVPLASSGLDEAADALGETGGQAFMSATRSEAGCVFTSP